MRPGGTKAESSGNYNTNLGLFKCFSTSTVFESEKAYTPFAVYTLLEHDGDFSKAASTLYEKGFGERQEKNIETPKSLSQLHGHKLPVKKEESKEDEKNIFDLARDTEFDYAAEIIEDEACLIMNQNHQNYKIGGFGMLGVVVLSLIHI